MYIPYYYSNILYNHYHYHILVHIAHLHIYIHIIDFLANPANPEYSVLLPYEHLAIADSYESKDVENALKSIAGPL